MNNKQSTSIDLFTPLTMGDQVLQNRIVMAPLTRNRAGQGDAPTELNALYYRQRATAGLIISEASPVSAQGVGYPHTPGIYSDEQIKGWRKVTDAVHEEGGKIFLQLWHVGRISHPSMQPDNAVPVAPSAIRPEGECMTYDGMQPFVTPHELGLDEIPRIIHDYEHAAQCGKDAGFDGIEIHAGNGYLLDQFLRDGTNQRTDSYGGSVKNRMYLLEQVIAAVKNVWPSERIGVRLSPENTFNDIHDSNPQQTFNTVTDMLAQQGLAYLHVVEGSMVSDDKSVDYNEIRQRFEGLYIANNGYSKDSAQQALSQGDADLIAFGRPYIANPDLPERFAQNTPLNEADVTTFYGGTETGYTDYPFLQDTTAQSA